MDAQLYIWKGISKLEKIGRFWGLDKILGNRGKGDIEPVLPSFGIRKVGQPHFDVSPGFGPRSFSNAALVCQCSGNLCSYSARPGQVK